EDVALVLHYTYFYFFFSSRRRHTRSKRDWSSDVCSSDLPGVFCAAARRFDRPEPAVARGVPQIAGLGVGGAKEDTLSRMRRRTRSEERRVGKEGRYGGSPGE